MPVAARSQPTPGLRSRMVGRQRPHTRPLDRCRRRALDGERLSGALSFGWGNARLAKHSSATQTPVTHVTGKRPLNSLGWPGGNLRLHPLPQEPWAPCGGCPGLFLWLGLW